jgi:hypothetical protein
MAGKGDLNPNRSRNLYEIELSFGIQAKTIDGAADSFGGGVVVSANVGWVVAGPAARVRTQSANRYRRQGVSA